MFSSIANHLWQSTLFAGGIGVLCFLLRNEGAHVRYWLWWTASVKFLIPFAALVKIGSSFAPDSAPFAFSERWARTSEIVAAPIGLSGLPLWLGVTLLSAWAIGSTAYIIRWSSKTMQIRQAVTRAEAKNPVKIGNQTIEMFYSHDTYEPSVVGLFKPILLVPHRIDEILSDEQLASVSAHELSHVRRRDNLTAVGQMITEAVFWFFPIVWLVGARLNVERERACDEAVVAQGHSRKSYAEAILNVCEHFVRSPLASSAGVSGGNLNKRIKHILGSRMMTNLGATKKVLLATTAACIVAVPVLFGFVAQASEESEVDLLPIVRIPPTYPPDALAQQLNGYVDLKFTITTEGTTEDIEVLSSTSTLFEESAVKALAQFKYEPMEAPVSNARIRIAFKLSN